MESFMAHPPGDVTGKAGFTTFEGVDVIRVLP